MDAEQAIARLHENIRIHDRFLDVAKAITDVVPLVTQGRAQAKWHLKVLSEAPSGAPTTRVSDDIAAQIEREAATLDLWPSLPAVERRLFEAAVSISTGGTAHYVEHYTRMAQTGRPDDIRYGQECTERLQAMQKEQNRSQAVREGLVAMGRPCLVSNFDDASKALSLFTAGLAKRTVPGNEIRNLLQGLHNDLCHRAERMPKENLSWQTIVGRLAKGSAGGPEYRALLDLEDGYRHLITKLSNVLKENERLFPYDLDLLWALALDHIHAVLGLVDWDKTVSS